MAAGWALIAVRIVFVDAIGPTVASLTGDHGVHAGDALALPALLIALAALAVGVAFLERGLGQRPAVVPLRPRRVSRPGRSS